MVLVSDRAYSDDTPPCRHPVNHFIFLFSELAFRCHGQTCEVNGRNEAHGGQNRLEERRTAICFPPAVLYEEIEVP